MPHSSEAEARDHGRSIASGAVAIFLKPRRRAWEEEVDGFTREQSLDSAWCGGGAKQCCTELKIHH